MRIIAGAAKGIRLGPVPAGTRPMSDMAREGLFASLGSAVTEAAVPRPVRGHRRGRDRGAVQAARSGRPSSTGPPEAASTIRENLGLTRLRGGRDGRAGRRRPRGSRDTLARKDSSTSCSATPRTSSQATPSATVLAALDAGWLAPEGWTVVVTRGHKSSTACRSGTLGRPEAAPLWGQPPHPVPGGAMGLTALCPGTFDPVTNGHLDVVRPCRGHVRRGRGGRLGESRPRRRCSRCRSGSALLEEALRDLRNVRVGAFGGLLVDYARVPGRGRDREGPAGRE